MGQTRNFAGFHTPTQENDPLRLESGELVIALAGNPNVGKSTIFNLLTGMNQHTGNWPGKTVASARGCFKTEKSECVLVDLPGTYSLVTHSPEEEITRGFLCSGVYDAVMLVCDATCLERNMNLVLQTLELTQKVIVCVNLLDEAAKKQIEIDIARLEERLGVPVIGIVGRSRKSKKKLLSAIDLLAESNVQKKAYTVKYPAPIEEAIGNLTAIAHEYEPSVHLSRHICLRLLEFDGDYEFSELLGSELNGLLTNAAGKLRCELTDDGIDLLKLDEIRVSANVRCAEEICKECVKIHSNKKSTGERFDRVLTGKITGYPIMLLFFAMILWLTIVGANYPSQMLSKLLLSFEAPIGAALAYMRAPDFLMGILIDGVYRTLAWVISVMLPPMAIFFPLFTLLEDAGFLPRIAYNLDKPFCACNACGKQALTMCMGFGCNAAGVVGCRIIDSERERLLAVLTNSFVPCNGRFPTLIALIGMFFLFSVNGGLASSILSALILCAVILLGIAATFVSTALLSVTLVKSKPCPFTIELPPYRRPQIGKVIIRSVFDRTLLVLARAVTVAAPAGALIWLLAHINIGGINMLTYISGILDPIGSIMGLDGAILLGFILGFPANEIVLPIILMIYSGSGSLSELGGLDATREILVQNGWTALTALNTMLFSLMHWPCSTTLLSVKKETGSIRMTLLATVLPTLFGFVLCLITALMFT
ncbi:MAG: ferrous iron transport protein B [Clostridia bacterium]|nr:ferrous iron transport protein B [Clostridia bacterium]